MMTIHALKGGDGYEYLTRQVTSGDRERERGQGLTDYYHAHGAPPGVWAGRGAQLMGVSGQVSEAQMRALFGEGMHPEADRIIAEAIEAGAGSREALREAGLGSGLYGFGGGRTPITEMYKRRKTEFLKEQGRSPSREEWLGLRTDAAREHLSQELGRAPTGEEIAEALTKEKRKARQAVVGWDCVFTPQKSVSILWGLGDQQMRQAIWECHEEAVREVLERMQEQYALARRGRGGKKIIDAQGLTFALFQHYDNRTGDPNPHTHAVASAMVCGSDDKWSCLDARALHQAAVSLSCQYNAAVTGKLKRRLGFRFQERRRGRGKEPVLEVVGVSDEMIAAFSRRQDILARTEQLVAEYRQTHGRDPSKTVQIKLAQKATLDTRADKPLPKSLAEMTTEWDQHARQFLGDGRTGAQFAADIEYRSRHPDAPQRFHAGRVAIRVGVALGGREAVLATEPEALGQVIDRELDGCVPDPSVTRIQAAMQVRLLLSPGFGGNLLAEVAEATAVEERRVYDPARIASEVTDKVSTRRATWVQTHIRAAAEDRLSLCDFSTDEQHRAAVEEVVARVQGQCVQLTLDPDPVPEALARANGESVFTLPASTTVRYTTEAVLAAEERLQTAAQQPTPEFVTRAAVAEAIEQVEQDTRPRVLGVPRGEPRRLKPGQRRIVEHLCTSGARLAVGVGPAGTGKTTALQAVVRAWRNDGRTVIALSQQMSAARVLGEEIGVRARTIDSFLTRARAGQDPGLRPGTMILVDEAGMAPTRNLDELQQIADACGAVVRWIGDPYQLSAVESGGALRLIAADTKAPELTEVVRFTNPAEAAATLAVRDGDTDKAWEFYTDNDRVTSGMVDELREKILHAHLEDTAQGKSSLMMAATLADVHALNGAAQATHAMQGTVDTHGPHAHLADGHHGYVGDVVVTRKNNNRLRITGGSRAHTPVDNGDLWRITAIHDDGSLSAAGTKHQGHVRLPAGYVREHVELGYASTVHRAQGITVDAAHLLMNTTLGRALAYVGLSRGKQHNALYIATDTLPDLALDHPPDEPVSEYEVFVRVLAREDDNLTATEVMRAEQDRISDPQRLRDIYDEATRLLAHGRGEYLLDRALPVALYADVAASGNFPRLLDTIGIADSLGINSAALVADIATDSYRDLGESLAGVRDSAAVLTARADQLIADHLQRSPENPGNTSTTASGQRFVALQDAPLADVRPVPSRYPGIDLELAELAESLHARLTGQTATFPPEGPEHATPAQNITEAQPGTHDPAEILLDQRVKIRRDYDYYVRQLAEEHARWIVHTALPKEVAATVAASPSYPELLDTLALADAHRLNMRPLIDALAADTNLHQYVLNMARNPAALIRARVDEFIAHATNNTSAATRKGAARWRALSELPPPAVIPVPPRHPGADQRIADYARGLRRQLITLHTREKQVRQQMRADPIRMYTDADLDAIISALHRAATGQSHPTPISGPGQPSRVEKVRAEHTQLAEQAALIRAAQTAKQAAYLATFAAGDAAEATRRARLRLEGISKLRPAARRQAQQLLTEAAAAENRAHTAAQQASDTAQAAATAACDAGAPSYHWRAILTHANNQAALDAEMRAAEDADNQAQHIQQRAARNLQTAQTERDRRLNLSPLDAAREQRIRAAAHTTTSRNKPTTAQLQTLARLQTEQSREHGPTQSL